MTEQPDRWRPCTSGPRRKKTSSTSGLLFGIVAPHHDEVLAPSMVANGKQRTETDIFRMALRRYLEIAD